MSTVKDDFVFLKGRPPLSDFLGVVKGQMELQAGDVETLSEEWRVANQTIEQLKDQEVGIANDLPASNLDDSLQYLVEALQKNTVFKEVYSLVPPVIGMVELDKLVVFQKFINLGHVEYLKGFVGEQLSAEEIFHFCFPVLGESPVPEPAIEHARVEKDGFVFMSPSADFRVLNTQVYDANSVQISCLNGQASSIAAMTLGLGANCLNVLRVNNRLVLNNGSHRAYALRSMGITHVPCVIQNITKNEELPMVATSEFLSNINEYISNLRPPLLKDYFNDELIKVLKVKRKNRQIKVSFKVDVMDVPAI